MFIGLWSFADDEGRMEYQPARVRMQIFPCGSVTLAKVREFIGELSEHSLIRTYTVDGKEFLDIPNFTKHQKINRPTTSKLPDYSLSTQCDITEDSPLELEGKGTGSIAGSPEGSPAPPRKANGKKPKTALPDGFALDGELRAYAEKHLPQVDVAALFESFCGKARAKSWVYADWRQAWQEYCRNCAPNSGHWAQGQYPKNGGAQQWM
jgi:hypothetical protein